MSTMLAVRYDLLPPTPPASLALLRPPMRPPLREATKNTDCFRASIGSFVSDAEAKASSELIISQICSDYGFQKRRLYDVINVLETVGCCKKTSVDTIQWLGLSKVAPTLIKLQKRAGVTDGSNTLDDIFPNERCISIAHMTSMFVMCFLVLKMETLDVKHIGMFLSRSNGRYKTTLCKLYQIAHILEAAGIIAKSVIPGEMTLEKRFFATVDVKDKEESNPFSIQGLLNRVSDIDYVTKRRRAEFMVKCDPSPRLPVIDPVQNAPRLVL